MTTLVLRSPDRKSSIVVVINRQNEENHLFDRTRGPCALQRLGIMFDPVLLVFRSGCAGGVRGSV
jgi:hypothetical protein